MEEIEVTIDKTLGSAIAALLQFANGVFPHTQHAVRNATILAKNTWQDIAARTFKHSTGTYVRAIEEGVTYPFQDDPLRGLVVNRDPKAGAIEHGYGPFDIKPGLLKSAKARRTKQGSPYIRIPFRHGLPTPASPKKATLPTMPPSVAKMAEQLVRQQTAGAGLKRLPQLGVQMRKFTPMALGLSPYTWKTGKFTGMVKTGSPRHSQYLTFRTVSGRSSASAWIHPGGKALRLCERAKRKCDPGVRALIKAGFDKDLDMLRRQIAGGA